jgi:hypothetical protein
MQDSRIGTEFVFCPAITRAGNVCGQRVEEGADFCHRHDPARAEERKRAASKAGKSKPLSESAKIRESILALIEEVKAGDVDPKIANCVAVLSNVAIGTLRLDAKLRELENIEGRLRDLEEAAKRDL